MHVSTMAGHLIRRLHQHSTQVFATLTRESGFSITSVQFAALDALAAHPGIDQAGVADLIAYDRATIGEVISRLVSRGLVERTINDTDRRARILRLTPAGEKLFAQLLPVVSDLQDEILAGLTQKDRSDLKALIARAIAQGKSSGN